MQKRIILSLDGMNKQDMAYYSLLLKDDVYAIKLNDAIFQYGSRIISYLKNQGVRIMADCKLYDIPNTITNNLKPLIDEGADIITVHGAALYKPNDDNVAERLATVTVLTSFTDKDWQILYDIDLCESILRFSEFAVENKYGYIVCSPLDLKKKLLKDLVQKNKIKTICPGIRLNKNNKDDHKGVVTPKDAFKLGADYIVMGRSLLSLKFEEMMASIEAINNGEL